MSFHHLHMLIRVSHAISCSVQADHRIYSATWKRELLHRQHTFLVHQKSKSMLAVLLGKEYLFVLPACLYDTPEDTGLDVL